MTKNRFRVLVAWLSIFGQIAYIATCASACTGIRIKPRDGSVICARTLEFGIDLKSNIIIIPRHKEFVGTAPGDKPGLKWTTKYGSVGTNAFGLPMIADGLNEKGLGVGIFYFPGYAKYQTVADSERSQALAPQELPAFLLGTCSTVKAAVEAAKRLKVGEAVFKEFGFVPPVHYVLHDASGECVVLEYVDGQLKIHDNPLGIVTNSPTFDWHVTNLRNYVNMSVLNVPQVELSGLKLSAFGQGSGLLGLPGDFTPPSRFIRAACFSQSALPVSTAHDGVLQAFHILNQFDIPKGSARDSEHGKEVSDYTLWTSVSDLTNLRYHFRTFQDSRIRMVDLKKANLDAKDVMTIPMAGEEVIVDVTDKAK
jgi:choloylglycine hydrolase